MCASQVWVLVYHVNEYYQEKEGYFLRAFRDRPLAEDLRGLVGEDLMEHVLRGGGRRDRENTWFCLFPTRLYGSESAPKESTPS